MSNLFNLALIASIALQASFSHGAPLVLDSISPINYNATAPLGYNSTTHLQLSKHRLLNASNAVTPGVSTPNVPPSGDDTSDHQTLKHLNVTKLPGVSAPVLSNSNSQRLPLSFVNNLAGTDINAYVTGIDSNNQLVFLQPNGQWYYPQSNSAPTKGTQPVTGDITIPVSSGRGNSSSVEARTTSLALPGYLQGGRIWFANGKLQFYTTNSDHGTQLVEPSVTDLGDPNSKVEWSSMELTTDTNSGVTADITFVDFVALPLGITLEANTGTQSAQGLVNTDVINHICGDLQNQAKADGQPWDQLCVTNSNSKFNPITNLTSSAANFSSSLNTTTSASSRPLRILSPTDYIDVNPHAFSGYFEEYVDQVWKHYANDTLTTNKGIKCSVKGDELNCEGDNRGYARPTSADIFGCNTGPFAVEKSDNKIHQAVVPWLCAAFNRHALLSTRGELQTGERTGFFTGSPTNWYSSIVHKHSIAGKGYAFSYDDVDPTDGVSLSGLVSSTEPNKLTVTIGGTSMS